MRDDEIMSTEDLTRDASVTYLLAHALQLLIECRNHMMDRQDTKGIKILEDRFLVLLKDIQKVLYVK